MQIRLKEACMSKGGYGSWKRGEPAIIHSHSIAKHRILRRYVERYIEVLTSNKRMDRLRLELVDGFAGGGSYYLEDTGEPHEGSPLILIRGVQAAEVLLNANREKPIKLDAHFTFIEQDPATLNLLRTSVTSAFGANFVSSDVDFVEGTFERNLNEVINQIKHRAQRSRIFRTIFVLDQYGYTDVSVKAIKNIFSTLPDAEVFLTYGIGSLTAYAGNINDVVSKIAQSLHSERTPQEHIDNIPKDATSATFVRTMRAAQPILRNIFMGEGGARCYTPFYIMSRESNRPYWFLHMANSPKANDVVKEIHWGNANHFVHYGEPGLDMLGYDPKDDPEITGQPSLEHRFEGSDELRTIQALGEQLPSRIRTRYGSNKVTARDLYADHCNETPASSMIMRKALNELCLANELIKEGASGEERRDSTIIRPDDVVYISTQQKLFSFSKR